MNAQRLQLLKRKEALNIGYRDMGRAIGKSHTLVRLVLLDIDTPFPVDREDVLESIDAYLTEAEQSLTEKAA